MPGTDTVGRVRQRGDGGRGTDYEIEFSWWRLSHTSRTRVTEADPPSYLAWRSREVRARGEWHVDPVDPPPDREAAARLRARVEFDPGSVRRVPRVVPFDRLAGMVAPVVRREARRVLRAVVADLEGARRPVEITVHETPSSV